MVIAYRLLVDTGVVPQPGQIPYVMGPASSETTELTAEEKFIAEFMETAIARAAGYGLPPIQPRPARNAGSVIEKSS